MKILNIGSLNIDYTYQLEHIVCPGETISSKQLEVFPGGKGLNQSIALARAGAKVYHAGKIGEDGMFLLDVCSSSGVNTQYIEVSTIRTGNAIIQVDNHGQNSIILYPGANRNLDKIYIDKVLSKFTSKDILVLQNEVNMLDYIIDQAYQKGMQIFFNPSPYDDFLKNIKLSKIHTILMNEVEGKQITGKEKPDQMLDVMLDRYPNTHVVLTLGKQGSYFQDANHRIYQPAYSVNAVDTTAAGDTFTGYYIASIFDGLDQKEALLLATKAAALSIQQSGASSSIPYRNEVLNSK